MHTTTYLVLEDTIPHTWQGHPGRVCALWWLSQEPRSMCGLVPEQIFHYTLSVAIMAAQAPQYTSYKWWSVYLLCLQLIWICLSSVCVCKVSVSCSFFCLPGKGKIQCLLPYDCCPNFSTVNTTQQKVIHSFWCLVTDDALIRALQPMTMSPSSSPTTSMHHQLKENLDLWEDIAFADLLSPRRFWWTIEHCDIGWGCRILLVAGQAPGGQDTGNVTHTCPLWNCFRRSLATIANSAIGISEFGVFDILYICPNRFHLSKSGRYRNFWVWRFWYFVYLSQHASLEQIKIEGICVTEFGISDITNALA